MVLKRGVVLSVKLQGNVKLFLLLFVLFLFVFEIKVRGGPWSELNCKEMGSEIVFGFVCLFCSCLFFKEM